ncbi:hypothetical protein E7T06_18510 [Deinococcus sp. Arct2-2]|uniref:tyrosine-type recombinase/integrase n=1 Tax=Deinococcus sp. Arct2-2 TaxID=2568653 RepID=UPI0010A39074|nr:tyrosine-type recombinase/integrase [Deinococcus sp. Arct2-2]THF68030.1 hypothetical protein E7T06_18510 [Deinococcus sp. Arct2-2]
MKESLRYDPDADLWCNDATAEIYFECDQDSNPPRLVNITAERWEGMINGYRYWINWDPEILNLPVHLIDQAREVLLILLKRRSPLYINQIRLSLIELSRLLPANITSWRDLTMAHWYHILTHVRKKNYLNYLRIMYRQVAALEKNPQMLRRSHQLDGYKSKSTTPLESMIHWDIRKGAFTTEEIEKIMQFLRKSKDKNEEEHALRIIAWLYMHLGKRPLQMMSINSTSLKTVIHNEVSQYFLEIPKAKAQRGRKAEQWEITADLAKEIQLFSARPAIRPLQQEADRLFIWPSECMGRPKNETFSTSQLGGLLRRYFRGSGLTTQRDKNLPATPLIFNARRARHTVGTQMAFDGAPAEFISRVLEHDSPGSAKAYIDAVFMQLQDAINKAEYSLGGIFAGLSEVYFSGHIVEEQTDRPIFVPDWTAGLLTVGCCNLDTHVYGECKKHPFFSCYGCSFFRALRGGAHAQALDYVAGLLQRWQESEGHPERSQMVVEFERLYQGISHVVRRVKVQAL